MPQWRRDDVVGSAESSIVLGEGVLRLLAVWGSGRGAVLVLDDLHWCDPDTLAVVEYLADHVPEQRVLILAATRPDAAGGVTARSLGARRAATVVHLPPLVPQQVAAVAARCLGTIDLPDGLVDVLTRAGGVPFLVEELLAAAADRGTLRRDGAGWVLGPGADRIVPATFAAGVAQRLGSLARSDRDVVLAGAVLGRRFDEAVPAEMVGRTDDDVRGSLRRGVGAQLLAIADGEFAFRHALTRDAVLACLTTAEQADLARRARVAIEARHPGLPGIWAEVAADVAVTAGDHDDAAGLLLVSGRAALADGALRTARQLLDRARDLAGAGTPRSVEIDEALLQVVTDAGDGDAVRAIGDRLAGADLDPDRRTHVHLLLAESAAAATAWDAAETELGRCRRTARADAGPRIDALAAHVALGQGRSGEAAELARRAQEAARRPEDAETACRALEVLGRIARLHDIDEAEGAFTEELRIAGRHGLTLWVVRATHELGTLDLIRSASSTRLERARELASDAGALATVAVLDLQLAAVRVLRWEVRGTIDAARGGPGDRLRRRLFRAEDLRRAARAPVVPAADDVGPMRFGTSIRIDLGRTDVPGALTMTSADFAGPEDRAEFERYMQPVLEGFAAEPSFLGTVLSTSGGAWPHHDRVDRHAGGACRGRPQPGAHRGHVAGAQRRDGVQRGHHRVGALPDQRPAPALRGLRPEGAPAGRCGHRRLRVRGFGRGDVVHLIATDFGARPSGVGDQLQRDRVDAVAQVRRGAVALALEHVPEVAVAGGAHDLDALHTHRVVGAFDDGLTGERGEERRPAAVRVELGVAAEQLRAARAALVDTGGLGVGVLAHERALGAGLAQHLVLGGGELRAPLGVGPDDGGGLLGGGGIHASQATSGPRQRAADPGEQTPYSHVVITNISASHTR